ncbi:MAG: thermonuclease family protein [Candidatus Levybacteria bacterium]|nr:thermonuclease family protein [Candidatus Levybacteria bacterium]
MRNLKFVYIIIFVVLFVFGGILTGDSKDLFIKPSVTQPIVKEGFFKVTKVIDGDTIKALVNDKEETVRLIGVDTPEVVDPRKPVQCFGKEASNKAKEILENKTIRLESDSTQGDKDKYGRLLRYVFLEDGANFNKLMIREGFAYEYTYNIPYNYQSEFKNAEKEARETKKGLWADGVCNSSN